LEVVISIRFFQKLQREDTENAQSEEEAMKRKVSDCAGDDQQK
jgi:hypothetical protein